MFGLNEPRNEIKYQKRISAQRKIFESSVFSRLVKIFPSLIFTMKDIRIASEDGIAVWNRTADTVVRRIFQEEDKPDYFAYYANKEGNSSVHHEKVSLEKPIGGVEEFFRNGERLLELGCGGGEAALGFAAVNPDMQVIGVDKAFGNEIPLRKSKLMNLRFEKIDWNDMPYEDGTFDRIISDQGAAYYYTSLSTAREISRVSKVGCIFRGSKDTGVVGRQGFLEELCDNGWDVFILSKDTNKFVAVYRGPDYKVDTPRPPALSADLIMDPQPSLARSQSEILVGGDEMFDEFR